MPKNTKKSNKEQAETKALWRTTTLFIVFGTVIFATFWWARNDDQSEVAQKIRDLIGIELLEKPTPEPAPEPVVAYVEPEPEPEPEPIIVEEPPAPEPEVIKWSEFVSRSDLWPQALKIMVDREITLTFQGNSFGEMTFNSGQVLNVMSFSGNGYVFGRTGGNEIEVHVSATNFRPWFEGKHGELYELTYPEKEQIKQADDFDQEMLTELRIWCMQNYNTPLIEINDNNLVLRLHSEERSETGGNYAPEALSVARAYLRIQARLGGNDNYASCEIRHPDTGQLLGSNGLFVPRF